MPFGLFKNSVSEAREMVISFNRVLANASALAGVFPWTRGAVGGEILLWG